MKGVARAEQREVPQGCYRGQRACYFLYFKVKDLLCIYHTSENMLILFLFPSIFLKGIFALILLRGHKMTLD